MGQRNIQHTTVDDSDNASHSTRCLLSYNRKLHSPVDRCHYRSISMKQRALRGIQRQGWRHDRNVLLTSRCRSSHEQLILSSMRNLMYLFRQFINRSSRHESASLALETECRRAGGLRVQAEEFFQVANCTCVLQAQPDSCIETTECLP